MKKVKPMLSVKKAWYEMQKKEYEVDKSSIGTIFDVRSIVGRLEKSLFCKNGFGSWEFGHHACLRMWYYLCLSSFAIPAMHMLNFFILRALKMVLHSKNRDWWESHFQSLFAPQGWKILLAVVLEITGCKIWIFFIHEQKKKLVKIGAFNHG